MSIKNINYIINFAWGIYVILQRRLFCARTAACLRGSCGSPCCWSSASALVGTISWVGCCVAPLHLPNPARLSLAWTFPWRIRWKTVGCWGAPPAPSAWGKSQPENRGPRRGGGWKGYWRPALPTSCCWGSSARWSWALPLEGGCVISQLTLLSAVFPAAALDVFLNLNNQVRNW